GAVLLGAEVLEVPGAAGGRQPPDEAEILERERHPVERPASPRLRLESSRGGERAGGVDGGEGADPGVESLDAGEALAGGLDRRELALADRIGDRREARQAGHAAGATSALT